MKILNENEGYKQAFYEIAEILGIGARADSPKNVFELVIKPKLEALMKERGRLASENITLANLVTSWPQERCPVTEAVTDVQPDDLFPETNSYLNSVRAEIVKQLYSEQKEWALHTWQYDNFDALKRAAVRHGDSELSGVIFMLDRIEGFAAKLRSGEPS